MTGTVYNITITADTEEQFVIPSNAKYILLKTRNALAPLKLAYAEGESGSNYITIPSGATKTMSGSVLSSMNDAKLYFQSTVGDVVEIESWV